MSTEPCDLCAGTGYLIDQTYEQTEMPVAHAMGGARFVERCDQCDRWDSDAIAAMHYADDVHGVAYAWHGHDGPGWFSELTDAWVVPNHADDAERIDGVVWMRDPDLIDT